MGDDEKDLEVSLLKDIITAEESIWKVFPFPAVNEYVLANNKLSEDFLNFVIQMARLIAEKWKVNLLVAMTLFIKLTSTALSLESPKVAQQLLTAAMSFLIAMYVKTLQEPIGPADPQRWH